MQTATAWTNGFHSWSLADHNRLFDISHVRDRQFNDVIIPLGDDSAPPLFVVLQITRDINRNSAATRKGLMFCDINYVR